MIFWNLGREGLKSFLGHFSLEKLSLTERVFSKNCIYEKQSDYGSEEHAKDLLNMIEFQLFLP